MNIKNEIQYQAALARANGFMDLAHNHAKSSTFKMLVSDIREYEDFIFGRFDRSMIPDHVAVKSNT